jgi:hypothetical protein
MQQWGNPGVEFLIILTAACHLYLQNKHALALIILQRFAIRMSSVKIFACQPGGRTV